MKKYGKYEKRPEGVPAKQPKVKSALLQTYFTSLLCMVLCVTMFFGTSYAWFTSEVSNTDNKIYIGTLDVGLFKENGTANPDDLADNDKKLFDSNIRWEPGYTALETIQVVNEGDLAFKYTLDFTDGSGKDSAAGVLTAEQLAAVSANFEVWVYNHQDTDYTYKKPNAYEEITEANGWVNVGTLDEILGDKVVLQDKVMKTVRLDDLAEGATTPTIAGTDRVATTDRYTIALHMNEMANSEVMGQKISLNVKLVAYQLASETDGLGNSTYDGELMTAATAEELKEALADSKNVILASNIEIAGADECVTMSAAMFDGNGKSITYSGGQNANGNSVGVVTTSGGKVSNLTINGRDNGRALYVTKLASDLVVSDCTLSGAYSFNLTSTTKNDNAMISFIDTKFTSWTSYDNVANHVYFTGCEFANVLRPYGDTTLTNCTFTTAGLDVSKLEAGEVITLINCTYKGQLIEKAVLTSNGGVVTISESDEIKVDNGMVVLKGNG